jgi:hypothetical protein
MWITRVRQTCLIPTNQEFWLPVFIGRRLGEDLRMDNKRHVFEKRLDSMLKIG